VIHVIRAIYLFQVLKICRKNTWVQAICRKDFYMKAQLASQLDNCNCDHMIHTQVFLTHHAEEYYFMLTKPQFTDD